MAKFSGKIGFSIQQEVQGSPDVWENVIIEKDYVGDILKNTQRYEKSGNANDNINVNVQISIIGNSFARENLGNIRYVVIGGTKWCVTSLDTPTYPPRITLTLGGLYNGQ